MMKIWGQLQKNERIPLSLPPDTNLAASRSCNSYPWSLENLHLIQIDLFCEQANHLNEHVGQYGPYATVDI